MDAHTTEIPLPPTSMSLEDYSASAMGSLQREYIQPVGDDQPSTFSLVQCLLARNKLAKSDIYDRGLAPPLLRDIEREIGELQSFLQSAAALVPTRTTHFVVDPGESCVPILDILRARLQTGHRFFTKYIEEFKSSQSIPSSPVSTVLGIHEQLQVLPNVDKCMRMIMQDIPRHAQALTGEKRSALMQGRPS
ncbi:hypothetical protein R3P38DRAFT_3177211 [Favolaschia claudopus]|uniref:Uncharacterized protein n=1 Tax=Favolaschia claudopus TaxID=2862362 RepID=A0AAW0D2Y5_9AGAR